MLGEKEEEMRSGSEGRRQQAMAVRCVVEGCQADLRVGKEYHRRHRVCEDHSKAPKVVSSGLEQRFCQQCSRLHVLSEFDNMKRSCRKRLAGHNERRRKSSRALTLTGGSSLFMDNPFVHNKSLVGCTNVLFNSWKEQQPYQIPYVSPLSLSLARGANSCSSNISTYGTNSSDAPSLLLSSAQLMGLALAPSSSSSNYFQSSYNNNDQTLVLQVGQTNDDQGGSNMGWEENMVVPSFLGVTKAYPFLG